MGSDNQVLIILANHDFKDEEYLATEKILSEAGATCKISALVSGECRGASGTSVTTDYGLSEVNPDEFSAIVFIGGVGVEPYLKDETVHSVAKTFFQLGKTIGAICWAPAILANAGVLQGKKATSWSGAKGDLDRGGAIYTGEPVTVDGKVITADGPDSAELFALEIAKRIF